MILNDFLFCFYNAGHADVVMGIIATNDDGIHERLRFLQNGLSH